MGRFLLSHIKIRVARNNSRYITGKLNNQICTGDRETDFISFSKRMIELLEPYLSKQNGGTAEIDKEIPLELRTITGCWIDCSVKEKFFKKYTKNIPFQNIKKGEYIRKKDGTVAVFQSLRIFCQYFIDELGQKTWIKGESPTEVYQREYKYRCVPYSENLEYILNQKKEKYRIAQTIPSDELSDNNYDETEYDDDNASSFYDDGLDMDQQSEEYWQELGIF